MADKIQREKTLLLMVLAAMMVLAVFMLRLSVVAQGSRAENVFSILTIIMLALIGVCVYQYIRTLEGNC